MPVPEGFYDLLFELSNEDRHGILLLIQGKAMRIMDIAREMNLNNPETRRHVSRLQEVGLIQRDNAGYYNLTPYGKASMLLIQEFMFLSSNREYFETHTLSRIPDGFIKRLGELAACVILTNPMDFFRYTENLLKESKEYVWLLVDQFPLNSLLTIAKAIDSGVKIRVVELRERILNLDLEAMTSEETKALLRTRHTPLLEERVVNGVGIYLLVSDKRCVLAFPTPDGQFDFKGFSATDDSSLGWCREIFLRYWGEAELRAVAPATQVRRGRISSQLESSQRIVVVGRELPDIDAQAVQDAVDNYDEVVLSGTFNFGASYVRISRSVVVTGDGREGDIPHTTIYKKGWAFPFTEYDCVFKLDGEDANITIENIQFTDFNHTCVWGYRCKNMNIRNNRITLATGYGRGVMFGDFGDVVIGIFIWPEPGTFKGNVTIEGNYVDFARGGASGGFLTRGGQEEDPEYRPNLFNHEYYMGFGVAVHEASGTVNIENNTIRNTNARGIAATCNLASANVQIKRNTITSDLYGSYPFSSHEAGAGILAQSAWGFPTPGFNVEIEENIIKLDKLNYSGIVVLGPVTDREGADKLRDGIIRGNSIQLKNGYEGIHVRKCDGFKVSRNTIKGDTYYGIRVSGRNKSNDIDLRSLNNVIEGNDMRNLKIRGNDEYSNNHTDGRMFSGSPGSAATAHLWLDKNSANNEVGLGKDETVIDEGVDNKIKYKKYPPS